jgi:hypothetical protein
VILEVIKFYDKLGFKQAGLEECNNFLNLKLDKLLLVIIA